MDSIGGFESNESRCGHTMSCGACTPESKLSAIIAPIFKTTKLSAFEHEKAFKKSVINDDGQYSELSGVPGVY